MASQSTTLLLVLLARVCLAVQVDPSTGQKATKDLEVESASYAYSKSSGDRHIPQRFHKYHVAGPSSFSGFHSGFNFPTKYRVGGFGVGSSLDDIDLGSKRLGLSFGVGTEDFEPSDFDSDELPVVKHGPVTFDLDDDSHDLLDHDEHHHHHHQEKGDKSSEGHESSGEKEKSKEYKVVEEFDKGEKGEKKRDQESGHHHEAAEAQKGHEHEERQYGEQEESAREAKGEHSSQSEGHRKGSKTTGFHNVYRKDEYKKDTTFYDDEHADAQHEQYSHEDKHRAKSEGEQRRAHELDEAHQQAEHSKKGFFTNGHQYGSAQGHDREEGSKEHKEHEESKHSSSEEKDGSSYDHH